MKTKITNCAKVIFIVYLAIVACVSLYQNFTNYVIECIPGSSSEFITQYINLDNIINFVIFEMQ